MKKSFIVAGILSLALWQMPVTSWAQNDDILIIEEDGGGSVEDLREELDRLADEIDDMRDIFSTLRKNVNVTGS